MVYDSTRDMTVLFGGYNGTNLNDTWEWNGSNWTQRTPATNPPSRTSFAMAYDSIRHVTVLFGGSQFDMNFGDTWEWDGTNWTQRSPITNPPSRYSHSMSYDSSRGVTMLFGGYGAGSNYLSDTWEWNGTNWTQRSPSTSPSARRYHAMAYDIARGMTVLFGGFAQGYTNDIWEWNGANWLQRFPATSPPSRIWHATAYDSASGATVLFGGLLNDNTILLRDTWEWNGTNWTQRSPSTSPARRYEHAMVYDSARGVTVLFGGSGPAGILGDTWVYGDSACHAPSIVQQPINRAASAGQSAVFSVTLSGNNPLTYHWRKNGMNLSNGGAITGANTSTLTINPASQSNEGSYDIVITNACGSATSNAATLSVLAQPQPGQYIPPNSVSLDGHIWQWDDSLHRFASPSEHPVSINPARPTYFVTHGRDGDLKGADDLDNTHVCHTNAMSSIGCAIRQARIAASLPEANLLAWDWEDAANPDNTCSNLTPYLVADLRISGDHALDQGRRLGKVLADMAAVPGSLGTELHFIGHSHGGGLLGEAGKHLPVDQRPNSLTTLDTPRVFCLPFNTCLVNTLRFIDPTESVRPGGRVVVLYYFDVLLGGFGQPLTGGNLENVTNISLNTYLASGSRHTFIHGPDNDASCPPNTTPSGWYNQAVWNQANNGPPQVRFNGTSVSSILSFSELPIGCYTEGATAYQFTGGACPQVLERDASPESETLGLALLVYENFDDASLWSGTNAQVVINADPSDAANRTILIDEQGDSSFFKDIAWPINSLEITFDYMFREPRGTESLTVYLNDEIIFYDNAGSTLAAEQLRSSGAIYIGQAAGTTARLSFVLRTDGTPGGSLVLDNLRIWGILPGDMNGDGKLDGQDIQPFINAVLAGSADPGEVYIADFDTSGTVDAADISPFVNALLNPGS